MTIEAEAPEVCTACVYYPPKLPARAYPEADWEVLQGKTCSYDFILDDKACRQTRKTSCSVVDLSG